MSERINENDNVQDPDVDNMTVAQYAAWLEEHHDDKEWEPAEIEVSPNLTIVVSVRFKKGELGAVAAAAESAGMPLSTYMRQVILDAVSTSPTSDEEFRQHLRALTESLRKSQEAAEELARDVQLSRHRSDGPVAA
jgi:predicted DNA binding CopG/RHH family protein